MPDWLPRLLAKGDDVVSRSVWWGGRRLGPSVFRIVGGAVVGRPSVLPTSHGRWMAFPPLDGTVIPGLHDAHGHAMLADLRALRAGGIASVVDLGGLGADLHALASAGRRPGGDLPRIAYAGAFLTVPGGYPSLAAWALPGSCRDVASPGHAAEAVREQVDAGATRIKAVVSTAHEAPTFDVATLTAVAEATHAAGLELVTHAQGPGAVEIALAAGTDVFAHTPWTERLPDDLLQRAAATTAWISTIDIHGYGEATPDRATALANLTDFVAAGGTVRYGTDYGNGPLPAGVNPREVAALQAAGLDTDAVLTAVTRGDDDLPVCWLPGGLPDDPNTLSATLTTAVVLAAPSPVEDA